MNAEERVKTSASKIGEASARGNPIVVVAGPTASGKTAYGARLAKSLGGEVVSADSVQVYKELDIGSAKPKAEEMLGVPHHMIDVVRPNEPYTVAKYKEQAQSVIADIISRGRRAVIVGGSGLYIQALTGNVKYPAKASDGGVYRELMERRYEDEGAIKIHGLLAALDAEAAARIHPNDKNRVVRALEAARFGGETISSQIARSKDEPPMYEFDIVGLWVERPILYDRINGRVDAMVNEGLFEETRALIERYGDRSPALCSIGYREAAAYLTGEMGRDEAVDRIKMQTRRYAKRQMTWFRKTPGLRWVDPAEPFST